MLVVRGVSSSVVVFDAGMPQEQSYIHRLQLD